MRDMFYASYYILTYIYIFARIKGNMRDRRCEIHNFFFRLEVDRHDVCVSNVRKSELGRPLFFLLPPIRNHQEVGIYSCPCLRLLTSYFFQCRTENDKKDDYIN